MRTGYRDGDRGGQCRCFGTYHYMRHYWLWHSAGLTRDEVIGQRYTVLEGPETDAATVQELWLAVHENREITVELVRRRDQLPPITSPLI